MPYEVILTRTAEKHFDRLPPKLQRGFERCLAWLETSPKHGPNIKRLSGLPGLFRFQIGGWRIVYEVDDHAEEVWVHDIRPRGDVYKH